MAKIFIAHVDNCMTPLGCDVALTWPVVLLPRWHGVLVNDLVVELATKRSGIGPEDLAR